MSEKLLNTEFHLFEHWDNGINEEPYEQAAPLYKGAINILSYPNTTKNCDIRQSFSVNDEVVLAEISSRAWRRTDADASLRVKLELEKPDTSMVTLYDVTETNTSVDNEFVNSLDITEHFDQYGTHKIWLTTWIVKLAGGLGFFWGRYMELNMTVKKYKSVHEKMGGTGRLNDVVSVKKGEIIGLVESYSTNVSPCQFSSASEAIGLVEGTSMLITRVRSAAESIGLVEGLQAVRTHGNLVTTYTIEDLLGWNAISPRSTSWIKTKIIT